MQLLVSLALVFSRRFRADSLQRLVSLLPVRHFVYWAEDGAVGRCEDFSETSILESFSWTHGATLLWHLTKIEIWSFGTKMLFIFLPFCLHSAVNESQRNLGHVTLTCFFKIALTCYQAVPFTLLTLAIGYLRCRRNISMRSQRRRSWNWSWPLTFALADGGQKTRPCARRPRHCAFCPADVAVSKQGCLFTASVRF